MYLIVCLLLTAAGAVLCEGAARLQRRGGAPLPLAALRFFGIALAAAGIVGALALFSGRIVLPLR